MAYANFSESGSTLTAQERSTEAVKILRLLEHQDWESRASQKAQEFLYQMFDDLESFGIVGCTIKQLFWLRDLRDQLLD